MVKIRINICLLERGKCPTGRVVRLYTNKNNGLNKRRRQQNGDDLPHLSDNLVYEMFLFGGLSSRNAIPQGVRDSTG